MSIFKGLPFALQHTLKVAFTSVMKITEVCLSLRFLEFGSQAFPLQHYSKLVSPKSVFFITCAFLISQAEPKEFFWYWLIFNDAGCYFKIDWITKNCRKGLALVTLIFLGELSALLFTLILGINRCVAGSSELTFILSLRELNPVTWRLHYIWILAALTLVGFAFSVASSCRSRNLLNRLRRLVKWSERKK